MIVKLEDDNTNTYIIKADKGDLSEILDLQYLAYQSEAKLFGNEDIPPLKQTLLDVEKQYPKQRYGLFLSVDWLSGKYPERLKKALDNCETVIITWVSGRLVGLINAIDDGELTADVHYLCVNPEYQGVGIGGELLKQIK